jgi:sugar lactone lactonase YvrE
VTAARTEAEVVVRASCQLGEGSLWDVEQALLYWVDIVGQRVFAYDPVEGSNVEYFVSEDVGTVVVARNGKLVLGLRSGVASFDPSTGQVTPLVAPEPQKPGNRLNDGKCDPRGRFWVGSMVEDGQRGNGALYCVDLIVQNCPGCRPHRVIEQPNLAQSIEHHMGNTGLTTTFFTLFT